MSNQGYYQSIFSLLWWGFLLAFVDFRLNGFNIIPDFPGFIMIALGLGKLTAHRDFRIAHFLAWCLVPLSLFSIYQLPQPNGFYAHFDLIGTLLFGFYTALVWKICGGIIFLAQMGNLSDLAHQAHYVRILFIGIFLSFPFIAFMAFLFQPILLIFVIVVLLFGLYVFVQMLLLLARTGRELDFAAHL